MHITCTKCSTRYVVKADSIGDKGRIVKCAKCGHKWHQKPATSEEKEKVKRIVTKNPASLSSGMPDIKESRIDSKDSIRANLNDIPPLSEEAQRVVKENSLPVKAKSEVIPAPLWVKVAVCLLILLIVPFSLLVYRDMIIEKYPASLKLYKQLSLAHDQGLSLENVSIKYKDRSTLVFEAMITNQSDFKAQFEGLQLKYYDKEDQEIASDYLSDSTWKQVAPLDNVYILEPLKNISVKTRKIILDIDFGNDLELLLY